MATQAQAKRDASAIESELSRIGLLLQHDARLPSATSFIAGEPIAGSWWGHALGNRIYAALVELERGRGKLSAKLVNGKITYVDRKLWPAFVCLASEQSEAASDGLSAVARRLLELTREGYRFRLDEAPANQIGTARERASAARELEQRVLLHSESEHTTSGAHVKRLTSWGDWARIAGVTPLADPSGARTELEEAVARLTASAARGVRVVFI